VMDGQRVEFEVARPQVGLVLGGLRLQAPSRQRHLMINITCFATVYRRQKASSRMLFAYSYVNIALAAASASTQIW